MPSISGVYVAAITPRRRGLEEIDLAAYWSLIDFLCASKVNGLVLMGSTGEFPHFTIEERIRMLPLAVKRARVPVIANVSHSTLDGAIALGQAAARAGAAAMLLMPPYFFRYNQEDIRAFYLRFLDELGDGTPLLLYNIPVFTSPIEPATAAALLEAGFAGIKDSGGDWPAFEETRSRAAGHDRVWLMGSDTLYRRARTEGANGVVSGCGAAMPELLLAMDRAITAGNTERAALLDTYLQEFISNIEPFPAPVGIREAVAARGLRTGEPAICFGQERTGQILRFREWFKEWYAGVQKECTRA